MLDILVLIAMLAVYLGFGIIFIFAFIGSAYRDFWRLLREYVCHKLADLFPTHGPKNNSKKGLAL